MRRYKKYKGILGYYPALLKYKINLAFQKPYFGRIYLAQQTTPDRVMAMRKLIREELREGKSDYNILELGSWTGSSAILWGEECKKVGVGKILCIDSWSNSTEYSGEMASGLKNNEIEELFKHNIRTSGLDSYVKYIRGTTDEILPKLEEKYDLIYIDACHLYNQVKKDIRNSLKLIKPGGIICGDDMDIVPNLSDMSFLEANRNIACIKYPGHGSVHPGVILAVLEEFKDKKINWESGFWSVRI